MSLIVKWILFDFGGCLDSDGVHSRALFLKHFRAHNLLPLNSSSQFFQEAYSYSDNKVIKDSLITSATLSEMNKAMCFLIGQQLNIDSPSQIIKVTNAITDEQSFYLRRNNAILKKLQEKFKLGVISNFSGNLEKIFHEFAYSSLFSFILDSYHVGVSKPDPEIFKLALGNCETDASAVCFIGDNIERDIIPAKKLGMKTILLSPILQSSEATHTLKSLEGLLPLTQTI